MKFLSYLKSLLGLGSPSYKKCVKSSNWAGANASRRIMNILSPNMTESTFNDRVKWAKGRGVDHFNLFLTNEKDGEYAGYSVYGPKFDQKKGVDKPFAKVMLDRVKKLRKKGYSVVLWMTADDTSWNKTMDFAKLCSDVKKLGFFKFASAVVVGLEVDEYWSSSKVAENVAILRKVSKLKVGVHQVSNKYDKMGLGDLAFAQVNPGTEPKKIGDFVKAVAKATGKPVCMFEMERGPDRKRSEAALAAGAYSVGNW